MKLVKKLTCLFLAIVMTMAMGITAFAANPSTFTITAPNNSHTYKIYQIMTGEFDGEGKIKDAKWGSNAASGYTQGNAVDASVLDAISKAGITETVTTPTDNQKAKALKNYVDMTGTPAGTVTNGSTVDLPAGYYVVTDQDEKLTGADDAYTLYIFKALNENFTIDPKTDKPSFEKKVKDTNDSQANSTTGWQDSADYDIGDIIPYKLEATLGDLTNYETYKLWFTDNMEHLTLVTNTPTYPIEVYLGSTKLTQNVDWSLGSDTAAHKLTVNVNDVIAKGAKKGDKVTVTYYATLDSDAVIGSAGNPNTAYLEYSNNPNDGGDGQKGKTPEDKNIVFTYKVVVNKVDANQQPLAGAKFKLQKKNAQGTYEDYKNGAEVEATLDSTTNQYTVNFKGLDDGDYKLVETKAPEGYTAAADVEFTISAKHDEEADNPTLTELKGGDKFTGNVAAGSLTTTVVNTTVSSLPSTGGMGTTVIYIAGIAMIVMAGVVVIARKRLA